MFYTSANSLYVLASRTICLTAATIAITPKQENTTAITVLIQKMKLFLDGLNVKLKNTTGRTKSRGMKPKAPSNEFISPKNGSIAAKTVATTTKRERAASRGMTFRTENSFFVGSLKALSKISFMPRVSATRPQFSEQKGET